MMPNLSLQTVWEKWRDAIRDSDSLSEFCTKKYGKDFKLIIGVNLKKSPSEDDCPCIAIDPGEKVEGPNVMPWSYKIPVTWAISNQGVTADGKVVTLDGLTECNEFGQLILSAIAEVNPSYPLDYSFEVDPVSFFPMFVGGIVPEIRIVPTIGTGISY